jgi:hypothetical protein
MVRQQRSSLSSNDAAVLSALFDPESSPSATVSISSAEPSLPHVPELILPSLQQREITAIRPLNTDSPSKSSIKAALSNLSDLITEQPKYAPAYLNRAQATRLLIGVDSDLFKPSSRTLVSSLLSDLDITIHLLTPASPASSPSKLQAELLSKAHAHRGYIYLKASQLPTSEPERGAALPAELGTLSNEQLEELASKDFFLGGRYGNKIARELSVKTNPYAKMCGEIVKEAMAREMGEYQKGMER